MLNDYSTSSSKNLGKVLKPIENINPFMFKASEYGHDYSIVASAVNALHLKLFTFRNNEGLIIGSAGFSILPNCENSEYGITTDIYPGTSIFNEYSPTVNSIISIKDKNEKSVFRKFILLNDIIEIKVKQRKKYSIKIENSINGNITFYNEKQKSSIIGKVLQPVWGTGRFPGTKYSKGSTVRANHPGVICVSTSLLGNIGGFQIVPIDHAKSIELNYVFNNSAYMIVKLNDDEKSAGKSPLFGGYITPGDNVFLYTNNNDYINLNPS